MRHRRPLAVSATLTAVIAGAAIGVLNQGVAGRAAASTDPATLRTLRYLQAQVGTDGSVTASAGATEDSVIGFADNGFDPATLRNATSGKTALDYLMAQTQAGKTDDTAGHTAKLILALEAAHRDPTSFGGVDLVTRLGTFYNASTGVFAAAAAGETPNVYSQSLSMLALASASHTVPAPALAQLACARRADGSYGYAITPTLPATAPACADTFGGDTNSTAIAMQGLVKGGGAVAPATLTWLHSVQHTDGGFDFDGTGTAGDPDSDATVIQGLVAAGQAPGSATWRVAGGGTPVSNMATFQDTATGGFTFPGKTAPDAFTTSQIPAAQAAVPYATATAFVTGLSPAPTPTPTPTPTATPTLRPSPTPTASLAALVGAPRTGGAAAEAGGGLTHLPVAVLAASALAALAGAWRRRRPRR